MHFFNLDGMLDDLKADRISERQYFRYLIGYAAAVGFPTEFLMSSEQAKRAPEPLLQLIGYGIGLGLLYWFLSSLFRANRGEHGKNFFLRHLMLSWVIGFRSYIVVVPMSLAVWCLNRFEVFSVSSGAMIFFTAALFFCFLGGLMYYTIKMHTAFRALAKHDQLTDCVE